MVSDDAHHVNVCSGGGFWPFEWDCVILSVLFITSLFFTVLSRMPEAKPKKTIRRRTTKKAASSPIPSGPVCSHEGCGTDGCRVRYVGPVSHLRDHYAWHAARGSEHIWAAAVTTGLALVLTGAIALTAAQAKQNEHDATLSSQNANRADIERIMNRLDRVERLVDETHGMLLKQVEPPTEESIMKSTLPASDASEQ